MSKHRAALAEEPPAPEEGEEEWFEEYIPELAAYRSSLLRQYGALVVGALVVIAGTVSFRALIDFIPYTLAYAFTLSALCSILVVAVLSVVASVLAWIRCEKERDKAYRVLIVALGDKNLRPSGKRGFDFPKWRTSQETMVDLVTGEKSRWEIYHRNDRVEFSRIV